MTWGIDFTRQAQSDLVGLDPDVTEGITDTLLAWMESGPPRQNERVPGGVRFYEGAVADRYLLAYAVKEEPPALVLLWLRRQPGLPPVDAG